MWTLINLPPFSLGFFFFSTFTIKLLFHIRFPLPFIGSLNILHNLRLPDSDSELYFSPIALGLGFRPCLDLQCAISYYLWPFWKVMRSKIQWTRTDIKTAVMWWQVKEIWVFYRGRFQGEKSQTLKQPWKKKKTTLHKGKVPVWGSKFVFSRFQICI